MPKNTKKKKKKKAVQSIKLFINGKKLTGYFTCVYNKIERVDFKERAPSDVESLEFLDGIALLEGNDWVYYYYMDSPYLTNEYKLDGFSSKEDIFSALGEMSPKEYSFRDSDHPDLKQEYINKFKREEIIKEVDLDLDGWTLGHPFHRIFLESPSDDSSNQVGIWECRADVQFRAVEVEVRAGNFLMEVTLDNEYKWYMIQPKEGKDIKEYFDYYYSKLVSDYDEREAKREAEGFYV